MSAFRGCRPRLDLGALESHHTTFGYCCDWPVYQPTGQALPGFLDCSRAGKHPVKLPSGRDVKYCGQHFRMWERMATSLSTGDRNRAFRHLREGGR